MRISIDTVNVTATTIVINTDTANVKTANVRNQEINHAVEHRPVTLSAIIKRHAPLANR